MSSAMKGLSGSMRTKLAQAREAELRGQFVAMCKRFGLPAPLVEHEFAKPERKWRCDFMWPRYGIALESEGGAFTQGRHTRGKGFLDDQAKYNDLAARGYRLFRTTPDQLCEFATIRMVAKALDVHLGGIGAL